MPLSPTNARKAFELTFGRWAPMNTLDVAFF
jgi:hypothetical protein